MESSPRICLSTVRRTTSSVAAVTASTPSNSTARNLVLNETLVMDGPYGQMQLQHKFIPRAVDGLEVERMRGIFLQLLPEPENVIVYRSR